MRLEEREEVIRRICMRCEIGRLEKRGVEIMIIYVLYLLREIVC